ncbi:MAG: acyltransferase [Naasia sp.]
MSESLPTRPTPTGSVPVGAPRVMGLDGLRGVAALVVVITHCLQVDPVLADAADGRIVEPDLLRAVLIYSPLHLLWAGMEAVLIFFVLSGYVLSRAAASRRFSWRSYYPSRLIRLYLPVWASIALALLVAAVIPRQSWPDASWFVNAHEPPTPESVVMNVVLLGPTDHLNVPLWSLVWEVWFSLLLPVYLLAARWTRGSLLRASGLVAALFVLMAVGSLASSNALRYLPVFALGVLLHTHEDVIATAFAKVGRTAPILAASAIGVVSFWLLQPLVGPDHPIALAARALQIVSAVAIVASVTHTTPGLRVFASGPAQWLGRVSFSLYLTHATVLIGVVTILGGVVPVWLTLLIVVPLSLLVAECFYRAAERPSHVLAKVLQARLTGSGPRDAR